MGNKSDRELLELAAKAAGFKLSDQRGCQLSGKGIALWIVGIGGFEVLWAPLIRDGDALRLAVKLELQLRLLHSENEVSVYGAPEGRVDEVVRGDPFSATRRAIVRAAAEIRKSMQ